MPLRELNLDIGDRVSPRRQILNYALSLGLFVAAFVVRMMLEGTLPPGFPYLTFFPAIVIATYYLGTRPGIFCAVLSFFTAWYFFLPPAGSFSLAGPAIVALLFFIFIVAVDVIIIDRMVTATRALSIAKSHAIQVAHQRDALFVELQHRVGNNLAMVSALLKVQARALPQEGARAALESAAERISIIADVSRMFHNPDHSMNRIDTPFLQNLAQKCLQANGAEARIAALATAQPIILPQEVFLPVALIVAECINNAIEHGFGSDGTGTITIDAQMSDGHYTIDISDTGIGLPVEFNLATTRSIGLKLVTSFVAQIHGTFAITSDAQTRSRLRFPVMHPQG